MQLALNFEDTKGNPLAAKVSNCMPTGYLRGLRASAGRKYRGQAVGAGSRFWNAGFPHAVDDPLSCCRMGRVFANDRR
jgi:hypothetical protein